MLKETITDFYNRLRHHRPDIELPDLNTDKDQMHFNVFDRAVVSKNVPMIFGHRDFYKISLLIGDGLLFFPDIKMKIEVKGRALLLTNPFTPYSWESTTDNPRGYFCLFTENLFYGRDDIQAASLLRQVRSNPVIHINQGQEALLIDIFNKMIRELHSEYIYKYDVLRTYVHLIIHEAFRQYPIDMSPKHDVASAQITSRFLDLLEKQFSANLTGQMLQLKSAKDFAVKLAVHVNHLNHAVKEVTARTTSDHIVRRMTIEAAALLRNTNLDIAEIAYCMGFNHPSNFNKFFKKQMKYTPKAYRLRYQ